MGIAYLSGLCSLQVSPGERVCKGGSGHMCGSWRNWDRFAESDPLFFHFSFFLIIVFSVSPNNLSNCFLFLFLYIVLTPHLIPK